MKRIKVSDATPLQIDWLVERAKGTHWSSNGYFCFTNPTRYDSNPEYRYSTEPSQGQPILEREKISLVPANQTDGWSAYRALVPIQQGCQMFGPTMLIAGLRCFIASKLGVEVDVPEEVLK